MFSTPVIVMDIASLKVFMLQVLTMSFTVTVMAFQCKMGLLNLLFTLQMPISFSFYHQQFMFGDLQRSLFVRCHSVRMLASKLATHILQSSISTPRNFAKQSFSPTYKQKIKHGFSSIKSLG